MDPGTSSTAPGSPGLAAIKVWDWPQSPLKTPEQLMQAPSADYAKSMQAHSLYKSFSLDVVLGEEPKAVMKKASSESSLKRLGSPASPLANDKPKQAAKPSPDAQWNGVVVSRHSRGGARLGSRPSSRVASPAREGSAGSGDTEALVDEASIADSEAGTEEGKAAAVAEMETLLLEISELQVMLTEAGSKLLLDSEAYKEWDSGLWTRLLGHALALRGYWEREP